jgi:TolB protein
VVFFHVDNGAAVTFTVSPDGSSLAPLPTVLDGYVAFWSPSGEKVAVMTGPPGNETISIMNSDGTGLTELTSAPGGDSFDPGYRANSYHDPWSPDGSRLAFASARDGNPEVYVASADGSGVVNVSNHPGGDRFDGWSPDGSRLVFSSDRSGSWDVYIVNRDGTGLRSVTDSPATEWQAVWVGG